MSECYTNNEEEKINTENSIDMYGVNNAHKYKACLLIFTTNLKLCLFRTKNQNEIFYVILLTEPE